MEATDKIIKLYSNNKKSARIKRRKNKFQRVWDAEKQTYVKIRKPKFEVYEKPEKKVKTVDEQIKAMKRRIKNRQAKKSVPVNAAKKQQKPEIKPVAKHKANAIPVATPARKATSVTLYGQKLIWDTESLKYKAAA